MRLSKLIWLPLWCFFGLSVLYAQAEDEEDYEDENYDILLPLNDPSSEGQMLFVEELLDLAGYVPENIVIYQTLPNQARVFRVKLDSINGGFVFVRFDKKTNENFVANKMIDPGIYYNLQAAKEILRRQTDKATLTKNDVAIQPSDQERITRGELSNLREGFQVKEQERLEVEKSAFEQRRDKARAKQLRKLKRKKNN
jgi:hypothetical protein